MILCSTDCETQFFITDFARHIHSFLRIPSTIDNTLSPSAFRNSKCSYALQTPRLRYPLVMCWGQKIPTSFPPCSVCLAVFSFPLIQLPNETHPTFPTPGSHMPSNAVVFLFVAIYLDAVNPASSYSIINASHIMHPWNIKHTSQMIFC